MKYISILYIVIYLLLGTACTKGQNLTFRDSLMILQDKLKSPGLSEINAAYIRNNAAILHIRLEQIDSAKRLIDLNILILAQIPDSIASDTYAALGSYYLYLSDMEEAKVNYRKNLQLKLKNYGENDCRTAYAYSLLGQYFNNRVILDSAIFYTKRAVDIIEKNLENKDLVPYELIYANYAYAYKIGNWHIGETRDALYDSVRSMFNKSLIITNEKYGENSFHSAMIRHHIANTYTDNTGHDRHLKRNYIETFRKAKRLYDQSYDIFKVTLGEKSLRCAISYYARGLLYMYTFEGDSVETAIEYLNKAIESLDVNMDIRKPNLIPDEITSLNNYQLYVLFFNKGWFIRTAGGENLSSNQQNHLKFINQVHLKLWDQFLKKFNSENVHQLLSIYSYLPFETAIKYYLEENNDSSTVKAFKVSDKAKYAQILKSTVNHGKNTNASIPELNVKSLQKLLDKETAFIDYFFSDKEIIVFIVTTDKLQYVIIPKPSGFEELIKNYLVGLKSSNISLFSDASYELYQAVFKPVQDILPDYINKLKIVTVERLSHISFEALLTERNPLNNKDFRKLSYLAQRYNISYAFSASLLLNTKEFITGSNFISFIPSYSDLNPLYFSKRLGENLQNEYIGDFYFDKQASSKRFTENNPSCEILHLSAHAKYDPTNVKNSCIYFSDHNGEDKLLLSGINKNSIDARLGVLMGCETGTGTVEYGEGMIGLTRAMKMAGVQNVISTLWPVDDEFTSLLLERFYNKLADGDLPEDALHYSRLDLLNSASSSDEANPYYWAGVIYTGNSTHIKIERKSKKVLFALLGLSVILGGVIFRKKLKFF